jgi:hypothetical protein
MMTRAMRTGELGRRHIHSRVESHRVPPSCLLPGRDCVAKRGELRCLSVLRGFIV